MKERTIMNKVVAAPRPITGRFVLICLIAFFGMIIGVNVVMMRYALETLPGVEVDSPYEAGLAYGRDIDAARDQANRGWKVSAHVARDSRGDASVRVEARDHNGNPITGLRFSAVLERPADRRADRPVDMVPEGDAVYRAKVSDLAPGLWDLVLEGDSGGQRMFLSKNRVVLN
jgi:nitrogen fixation protein FixH